jgi:hypothetical protein
MARKIQAHQNDLPQQLRGLLYRHTTYHPSDVANARLLERLIVQPEQPREKRKPIQEEIPGSAYTFIPGHPESAAAPRVLRSDTNSARPVGATESSEARALTATFGHANFVQETEE